MHELSVTESILRIVLKQIDRSSCHKIKEVGIVIGQMSSFIPDCIEYYFNFLSRGTAAEGANLKFNIIKPSILCRHCDQEMEIDDPFMTCPVCGNADTRLVSGRECYVEYIEVDDEED
ncbi:MAG TPA: hydrogenase maturation nickel metallochaperone HypA [bacterium (Candidatus Stahlbacteria)]|nr:hydrogenase maturation nickel metallochaperone HypA [Candidatus Stahlbacteria bacterium]